MPACRYRAVVSCIRLFDDAALNDPHPTSALQSSPKRPMSVQHGQDQNALWLDEIDEAIGANDEFAKAG